MHIHPIVLIVQTHSASTSSDLKVFYTTTSILNVLTGSGVHPLIPPLFETAQRPSTAAHAVITCNQCSPRYNTP